MMENHKRELNRYNECISSSRLECGKEYNNVLVSRGLNRANIHARTIEEHGDRSFQFIHY
jgi:hypothetical protein